MILRNPRPPTLPIMPHIVPFSVRARGRGQRSLFATAILRAAPTSLSHPVDFRMRHRPGAIYFAIE